MKHRKLVRRNLGLHPRPVVEGPHSRAVEDPHSRAVEGPHSLEVEDRRSLVEKGNSPPRVNSCPHRLYNKTHRIKMYLIVNYRKRYELFCCTDGSASC